MTTSSPPPLHISETSPTVAMVEPGDATAEVSPVDERGAWASVGAVGGITAVLVLVYVAVRVHQHYTRKAAGAGMKASKEKDVTEDHHAQWQTHLQLKDRRVSCDQQPTCSSSSSTVGNEYLKTSITESNDHSDSRNSAQDGDNNNNNNDGFEEDKMATYGNSNEAFHEDGSAASGHTHSPCFTSEA